MDQIQLIDSGGLFSLEECYLKFMTLMCALSRSIRGRCVQVLACLFVAGWMMGCGGDPGPERATVKGVVSLDDKPLAQGQIRFIPTAGGPAAAGTIKDGKFEIGEASGPVIGQHRVEIEATGYEGFAIDDEAAYAEAEKKTGGRPIPKNPVPDTYNKKSTLTAEIKADSDNAQDFKLKSAGK